MDKLQRSATLKEATPAELERNKKSLAQVFHDHQVDVEKHKSFFDDLVEWKRHL